MGVLDTLDEASPAQRTVTLILNAKLHAEVQAIEASMDAAIEQDKLDGTMADPAPNYNAAIKRREVIRNKIAASEVTFTFERIDPWEKVALQAEHPPRPGNLVDLSRGYNYETFLPALIRHSVIAVTDAKGDTSTDIPAEKWDSLLGVAAEPARDADADKPATPAIKGVKAKLNTQQLQELIDGALTVNDGSPGVPLSALSCLVSQDSGESSTPPGPGAPPRAAGTGGRRRTPPKSSGGRKPTAKKAAAKKATSARSRAS